MNQTTILTVRAQHQPRIPHHRPIPSQKNGKTNPHRCGPFFCELLVKYSFLLQKKLFEFLAFRDSWLDELLRHDGLANSIASPKCYSCGCANATIKCKDCFCQLLRCHTCTVKAHKELPLHRISVYRNWRTGTCTADVTRRNGMASFLIRPRFRN